MKLGRSRRKNQTVVEYILIITLVAVASITVLGIFSDRIRTLIAGAASSFGAANAADAASNSSVEILKTIDGSGIQTNGN